MTPPTTATLWQGIHDTLAGEIGAARYAPGAKLPTEAELARRFGVNRHTVRRALAALAEAGRIHVRRGAGAFVTQARLDYAIGPRTRFSQNLADAGHTPERTLLRIELPLAWPGVLSALVLTFAHTMGEFGVVLMVGGNIPEQTRTLAIAIYDRTQVFDDHAAGVMSASLLALSFAVVWCVYLMDARTRTSAQRL